MNVPNSKITIGINQERTEIKLHSGVGTFARITMTPEQLSMALSRLAYTECEILLTGVENLGKTKVTAKMDFIIPESIRRDEVAIHGKAIAAARAQGKGDWTVQGYFNRKGQVRVNERGEVVVTAYLFKYVDENATPTPYQVVYAVDEFRKFKEKYPHPDAQYDEIKELTSTLGRGVMLEIFEYLQSQKK